MQLQLWENQMSPKRWDRYRKSEQLVLAEIDRQAQISDSRYLGDVPDLDDNQDYIPREEPVEEWFFPVS
jgi:hypothetical protein